MDTSLIAIKGNIRGCLLARGSANEILHQCEIKQINSGISR